MIRLDLSLPNPNPISQHKIQRERLDHTHRPMNDVRDEQMRYHVRYKRQKSDQTAYNRHFAETGATKNRKLVKTQRHVVHTPSKLEKKNIRQSVTT